MRKNIFKVIGIVLGSIIAFVGAVVGVLAIMGKFKKPIVYPTSLVFLNSEYEEVNYADNSVKFFTLNGFADGDNEVNQKTCDLFFEEGKNLIELLHNDNGIFTPITPEAGFYKIECNEPVYYRFKDATSPTGKVVMQAYDEKHLVMSNKLTLWIDSAVKDLYISNGLGYTPLNNQINNGEQEITLSMGQSKYFDFSTSPVNALKPNAYHNQNKQVEIYYFEDDAMDDYQPVNANFVANSNFMFYDANSDSYYFQSSIAGEYQFYIAVFDSYTKEQNYTQNTTYFNRVKDMVSTSLKITVKNLDIDKLTMASEEVELYLYSNNNYITLNGTPQGVPSSDIVNNNLVLNMSINEQTITDRLDEADFNLEASRNWQADNTVFENKAEGYKLVFGDNNRVAISGFDGGILDGSYTYNISGGFININEQHLTLTINYDNVQIGNKRIIKSLGYGVNTLTCSNGAGFDENGALCLLKTGTFLDFYNLEGSIYSKCYAFDYDVTASGFGNNRTFNIVAKNKVDNLYLLVLVVNSNGGYYYATTKTIINETELSYEDVNRARNYTLDVKYEMTGAGNYITSYGELDKNQIVTVNSGSYDAVVFVTPKSASYSVEVIENITYEFNGQTYVLVGYFDGTTFKNKVKAKNGAEVSTSIYVLQLKNNYKQNVEDYFTNLITSADVLAEYSFNYQNEDLEQITVNLTVKFTKNSNQINVTLQSTDTTENITLTLVGNSLYSKLGENQYLCTFKTIGMGQDLEKLL